MSGHAGTITCVSSRAPFARFQANPWLWWENMLNYLTRVLWGSGKGPGCIYIYIYINKYLSWLKVSHAEMDEAEAQLSQARPSWLSLMFQSVYDENANIFVLELLVRPLRVTHGCLRDPKMIPGAKVFITMPCKCAVLGANHTHEAGLNSIFRFANRPSGRCVLFLIDDLF